MAQGERCTWAYIPHKHPQTSYTAHRAAKNSLLAPGRYLGRLWPRIMGRKVRRSLTFEILHKSKDKTHCKGKGSGCVCGHYKKTLISSEVFFFSPSGHNSRYMAHIYGQKMYELFPRTITVGAGSFWCTNYRERWGWTKCSPKLLVDALKMTSLLRGSPRAFRQTLLVMSLHIIWCDAIHGW